MSAAKLPSTRLTTVALCKGEDSSRNARRILFNGGKPPGEVEFFAVAALIEEAIASLVSARAHLPTSALSEGAST